jgi:hypothetical protein
MRYDEAYTVLTYAKPSLLASASVYSAPNNHVLHTLLVGMSIRLFGDTEWAIRLPAFLAGVLLIPATYVAGRVLDDWRTGLLGAAFVAGSSEMILYSTNARGYTIAGLIVMALFAVVGLLRHKPEVAGWLLFAVLAALGLYVVPVTLYPLMGVMLWVAATAVTAPRPEAWPMIRYLGLAALGGAALTVLLYSPVGFVSGFRSLYGNTYFTRLPWPDLVAELWRVSNSVLTDWRSGMPVAVAVLAVSGMAAALARGITRPVVQIFVAILIATSASLVISRKIPPTRGFLPLLPSAALAAGGGITTMLSFLKASPGATDRLVQLLAATIGVWGVATVVQSRSPYWSNATGTLRDAREVARTLRGVVGRGDLVLASVPSSLPLRYYFERYAMDRHLIADTPRAAQRVFVLVDRDEGQTLATQLTRAGAGLATCASPVVIRHFRAATLYELEHARPGCPAVWSEVAPP